MDIYKEYLMHSSGRTAPQYRKKKKNQAASERQQLIERRGTTKSLGSNKTPTNRLNGVAGQSVADRQLKENKMNVYNEERHLVRQRQEERANRRARAERNANSTETQAILRGARARSDAAANSGNYNTGNRSVSDIPNTQTPSYNKPRRKAVTRNQGSQQTQIHYTKNDSAAYWKSQLNQLLRSGQGITKLYNRRTGQMDTMTAREAQLAYDFLEGRMDANEIDEWMALSDQRIDDLLNNLEIPSGAMTQSRNPLRRR